MSRDCSTAAAESDIDQHQSQKKATKTKHLRKRGNQTTEHHKSDQQGDACMYEESDQQGDACMYDESDLDLGPSTQELAQELAQEQPASRVAKPPPARADHSLADLLGSDRYTLCLLSH